MINEDPCGDTGPGVALQSSGLRACPGRSHLAFSLSISSHPAAEKSLAPCASEGGPRRGLGRKIPTGEPPPHCSALALGARTQLGLATLFGRGVREQVLQNRGECQRQTNSLFNNDERTFEASLKYIMCEEWRISPFISSRNKDKGHGDQLFALICR